MLGLPIHSQGAGCTQLDSCHDCMRPSPTLLKGLPCLPNLGRARPPASGCPQGVPPPPLSSPPMPVGNGVEVGTYHDTWQFLQEHGEADGWL